MSRYQRMVVVIAMLAAAAANSVTAQVAPVTSVKATPWDSSLTLEASGKFDQARAVLVLAFGAHPSTYDVAVRLAWLSLRQHRALEAVQAYREARALPYAGFEATQGLASALVMSGYQALDRGNLGVARRTWREALAADRDVIGAHEGLALVGPSAGAAPEIWFGQLKASTDSSSAQAVYLALPYRVNDATSVRAAFRDISSAHAATGTTGIFGSQREFYGSITMERGISATEVMALALSNSAETISGVAASTRLGGKSGVTFTVSALHQTRGWNTQFTPSAFTWLGSAVALWGGVRITKDSTFSATSPLAGMTLRAGHFELDGQVHLGKERLAFGMAGPTVMSFVASTSHGEMLTGSLALGRNRAVVLFGQWQAERLKTIDGTTDNGNCTALAAGVRWIPGRNHLERMP